MISAFNLTFLCFLELFYEYIAPCGLSKNRNIWRSCNCWVLNLQLCQSEISINIRKDVLLKMGGWMNGFQLALDMYLQQKPHIFLLSADFLYSTMQYTCCVLKPGLGTTSLDMTVKSERFLNATIHYKSS